MGKVPCCSSDVGFSAISSLRAQEEEEERLHQLEMEAARLTELGRPRRQDKGLSVSLQRSWAIVLCSCGVLVEALRSPWLPADLISFAVVNPPRNQGQWGREASNNPKPIQTLVDPSRPLHGPYYWSSRAPFSLGSNLEYRMQGFAHT